METVLWAGTCPTCPWGLILGYCLGPEKNILHFQKTVPLVKSETGLGISQYLCLKKESR